MTLHHSDVKKFTPTAFAKAVSLAVVSLAFGAAVVSADNNGCTVRTCFGLGDVPDNNRVYAYSALRNNRQAQDYGENHNVAVMRASNGRTEGYERGPSARCNGCESLRADLNTRYKECHYYMVHNDESTDANGNSRAHAYFCGPTRQ